MIKQLTDKVHNILKSQLYTVSVYCRQMAGTLVILLIARYLSVHDFGLFSSYKSIAVFCLLFANLDYDLYILVSSKANTHEVRLKISLFLLNTFFIISMVTLGSMFFDIENHILFLLVLLRTFFDTTFFCLVLPYFQATKKFSTIAKINILYGLTISAIAIYSYINKLSLLHFLILNICAGIINFIQCTYFSKINFFMALTKIKRFFQMLDKTIFSFMGSSITSYIYTQITALYVAVFLLKEQAALFFAAFTISSITSLFAAARIQKMLPELINKNTKEQIRIIKKNCIVMISVFGLILLCFGLFGKYILKLIYLKDYYQNAYLVLLILTFANAIVGLGRVFGNYIAVVGKQAMKIRFKFETSIISILGLVCFHKFGITGPAIVVAISSIYNTMRYILFSLKMIKINLKKETQSE
ncbi:MAG: hypothetical protein K6A44_07610 [bacterium]|nr:hypothetical protein [bacterium]